MSKRKSTGKRARFEVFKRDGFTCQYCGAQPPGVVLVCDHITPVALGGTNDLHNLITACEPCNQGKADKPLGEIHPRPDADLMYLETQQEVMELRRFQEAERNKQEALNSVVEIIRNRFYELVEIDWMPHPKVLKQMLSKYSPELVIEAIEALAYKVRRTEDLRSLEWVPYTWAVLKRIQQNSVDEEVSIRFANLECGEQEFFLNMLGSALIDAQYPAELSKSEQELRARHAIGEFIYNNASEFSGPNGVWLKSLIEYIETENCSNFEDDAA